jgi:succinyl-diaminopimelate desuccinylase
MSTCEAALARSLLWLCEIPSPTGSERKLCDAIAERLAHCQLGAPVRRYDDSLVVPLTRGTGGPRIALVGHLDVVPVEHDGPPRIEGDRVFGAGASDMKAGLAVMLDFATRARRPQLDLTLLFYACEEGPLRENQLGPVLGTDPDLEHVQLAVCLEPSDNRLQLGCAGSLHATVRFQGKAAHSARPWQGDNAIHKSAPFLERLRAYEQREGSVEGLTWTSVCSATMARAGRARNVIPDVFELNVNARFGPDRTIEQVRAELLALCAGEAELVVVEAAPAAVPHRSHPWVRALANSGVRDVEAKQAWTDVATFAARDIPAVNFGPGAGAQAHQRNEWASIPAMTEARVILTRWLDELAANFEDGRGQAHAHPSVE